MALVCAALGGALFISAAYGDASLEFKAPTVCTVVFKNQDGVPVATVNVCLGTLDLGPAATREKNAQETWRVLKAVGPRVVMDIERDWCWQELLGRVPYVP